MSLLPIIYSSILIFSGILVFVVILSYVSFKTKGEAKYNSEDNEKRDGINPHLRQLKYVPDKAAENEAKRNYEVERNLQSKKIKAVSKEPESEYRRKTKKFDKEKISVLYKKKDFFNRTRPEFKEPRFSIVKDISEHLEINKFNTEAESASHQTVHVMEVGAVDYLKFYENY